MKIVTRALAAMARPPPPLIAVIGSTGTGKTKLGAYLCKHLNGQIVSVDSMQVYKVRMLA